MKKMIFLLFLLSFPSILLAARRSPVDHGVVTSGVGWRVDPFGSGRMVYHNGYDIAVPVGTPVYPTQAGTVYFAGPFKGYGNLVAILHGKGFVSFYGHNSKILVRPGQQVDTDTVIALSGSTGRSTGPHVHYEVRRLPGYDRDEREHLQKSVRVVVQNNAERPPEGGLNGKGGPEGEEKLLPGDQGE